MLLAIALVSVMFFGLGLPLRLRAGRGKGQAEDGVDQVFLVLLIIVNNFSAFVLFLICLFDA